MKLSFSSQSSNVSFARVTVASFISQLDPTIDELTEIKTVVSEAVTNSIIHGYNNEPNHLITITCEINNENVLLSVSDQGIGIDNIEEAKQPLYTSKPDLERTGMGLTIIETFMDSLEILSSTREGTTLNMKRQLKTSKTMSK